MVHLSGRVEPVSYRSDAIQRNRRLGQWRIEVEGCEISFSYEDPGIQVSFEGKMSQARANALIEEIKQAVEAAGQEPATVVQISW